MALIAVPNPVKDKLTLLYHSSTPGPVSIAMVDIQGMIVWQLNDYPTAEGVNEIEATIGSMESGVYTCRLLRSGRVTTVRIVKC